MTITVDYATAHPDDVAFLLAAKRAERERHLAEVAAADAAIATLELIASLDADAVVANPVGFAGGGCGSSVYLPPRPLPPPSGDPRWRVDLPLRRPGAATPAVTGEWHPERGDPPRARTEVTT